MSTRIFSSPESSISGFFFVWLTCFPYLFSVYGSASETKQNRPVINVTKHISFPDFSLQNPRIFYDVKLLGSAKLLNEKGVVQIPGETNFSDLRHLAGRAIYSWPVRLFDPFTETPASFETTFSFRLSKATQLNSSGSEMGNHEGSGMTFIIVPDEFTVGRAGPWLAMLNDACQENYKAVGFEFDTRQNPEFGDPNDNHVGINLGSIVSTVTANAYDVGVFLKDGSVHRAWISYDGKQKWIDIRLGLDGLEYPSKSIISGPLDLSPHLNEYMFVGFSASTGNMIQLHQVHSWNFTATSQAFLRIPSSESCESKITFPSSADLTSQKKNHKKEPHLVFLILGAVVTAVAVVVALWFFCSSKEQNSNSKLVVLPEKKQRPSSLIKPRRLTSSEISSATQGFSEGEELGSDCRGVYYKGKLSGGCEIAVKRFSAKFLSSQQGSDKRRLLKEISAMSLVRHPNLAPVRGWCHDRRDVMVVYDFYTNGSLDKWLFGVGVLPWTRRFKVIKDVAEGLSFLHSKRLAHKNMKTSSVFVDVSFRALLGDYGFVLSAMESQRFEAAVSQKADVFEFGIFVLELVSGRRKLDSELNQEEKDLVDFAWRMHEMDEKAKVVDGRLGSLVNLEQAIQVLEIGLLCTLNESKGRPSMGDIVEFLSLERHIPELPASRPMVLCPYNSATGLCPGYSCGAFN
ncbi:hypothetical protein SLEP1_g34904 [Rubroshorea leprosula]|uniref:Protein kinase domain-containing protein n=1 Tax=Rubroshorea leprosula TaxID=152421 RepID=A0AAV5KLU3_9ROSI|nr:hypothetical protein SLEP1_g34904 [Rubroshorea leprosula]